MSDAPDAPERDGNERTQDERTDPLERHRFVVDADGLAATGFSEVKGLEVAVEDGSSRDDSGAGGWWNWRRRLRRLTGVRVAPDTATSSPNLELRRGVTDDPLLWDWLRAWTAGEAGARDLDVYLLDADGEPAVGWTCSAARPVKWTGPTLRADTPGVAVETLELAHDGITEAAGEPGDEPREGFRASRERFDVADEVVDPESDEE